MMIRGTFFQGEGFPLSKGAMTFPKPNQSHTVLWERLGLVGCKRDAGKGAKQAFQDLRKQLVAGGAKEADSPCGETLAVCKARDLGGFESCNVYGFNVDAREWWAVEKV